MPKSTPIVTVAVALLLLGSACTDGRADSVETPAAKAEQAGAATATDKRKTAKQQTEGADDRTDKRADNGANKKADKKADKRSSETKANRGSEDRRPPSKTPESDAPESDEPSDDGSNTPVGTLTVQGAPFDTLSFPTVQCASDGADLYLQSRSKDPAVMLTVLFSDGKAAHASLQTDPASGESTIWSDEDAAAMAESIKRDDDTITLSDVVLTPFDDGADITVSGSVTCTEKL